MPKLLADTRLANISPLNRMMLQMAGWEFTTVKLYTGTQNTHKDVYGVLRRTRTNPAGTAMNPQPGLPTLIGRRKCPDVDSDHIRGYVNADESWIDPEDVYPLVNQDNPEETMFVTPFKDEFNYTYLVEIKYPSFPSSEGGVKTPLMGALESYDTNRRSSAAPLAIPQGHTTLSTIPSIGLMRSNPEDCLVIATDSEYYYNDAGERVMLTYQFAFVHPETDEVVEIIVYSLDGSRVKLSRVLVWIIEEYGLLDCQPLMSTGLDSKGLRYDKTRVWKVPVLTDKGKVVVRRFMSQAEAIKETCDSDVRDFLKSFGKRDHKLKLDENGEPAEPAGYVNEYQEANKYAIPITLLFHSAKNDMSGFGRGKYEPDLILRMSDIQGGLVSLRDTYIHPHSGNRYWCFFPIRLSVRDTMCFAPDGKRHLEDLGDVIQVPKLDVLDSELGEHLLSRAVPAKAAREEIKDHMDRLLDADPVNFLEYASQDAVVTLCYASELWGYNCSMPVTITSASAKVAKGIIGGVVGDVDSNYRGLKKISRGLVKPANRAGYIENSSLVPLNENCDRIQRQAQNSYHGGFNGSTSIGFIEGMTHDFDLMNAYPTCMSIVPDIDWSGESTGRVIYREWTSGQRLTLQDFHSPFDPIFGYVDFAFPDSVSYPCIPVQVESCLVFPRTSEGLDGVYASGPEIYLALRLGATVTVAKHGSVVQAGYRLDDNGNVSHSLYHVVHQLVADRTYAKQTFGEDSLADLLLKVAVNSIYGKTAQDVVEKWTWDAFKDEMVNIGGSSITSPVHACLTTAGVRAVLVAAMNELDQLGFKTYSVTTDGFITDADADVMDKLSLFGFSQIFRAARHALTGEDSMWKEKHCQQEFLNFTTRGNVALNVGGVVNFDADYNADDLIDGVCAHNSFVTGFEEDSFEDRLALMKSVLTRTGRVQCENKVWTKFRKLAAREHREDFSVDKKIRNISMDFDMKRKPVRDSFVTVYPVLNGEKYEIANFDTEPFENVGEYLVYRKALKRILDRDACLRTMEDWKLFWHYVDNAGSSTVRIKDLDWTILMSCVRGWRYHGWSIPYLDGDHKIEEKIEFLNRFNTSKKKFDRNAWRNAMRSKRADDILAYETCEDLLEAMRSVGDRMPDKDEKI